MPIAKLNRTVLKISGDGAAAWLEGLITNSISGPLTFAALLTPQGKIIADFFVWHQNGLFIDTPSKFGDVLHKRLKMYRLRAPITIEDVSGAYSVFAVWGEDAQKTISDPRNGAVGRILQTSERPPAFEIFSESEWDAQRLALNLPDSQWDFETADVFPANANMDRLNGINFKKGCYVGQEVVSRMYRKTDIRKRMSAFTFSTPLGGDQIGDTITLNGRTVGDVLHINGGRGMAMVRFDRIPESPPPMRVGEEDITLVN